MAIQRPSGRDWCFVVVLDGPLVLPEVDVGKATVIVGLGILRVEADGFIKVLN